MARFQHRCIHAAVALAVLFAAAGAWPESMTLYVPRASGAEPVPFEVMRPQEKPYLSLGALTRALGGAVRILPARVQLDLGGHTAVAWVNGVRVSSSQGTFTLENPLLRHDDDVLIAAEDTAAFFERAFLTTLYTEPPAGEASVSETAEGGDLDELESALLAEPIAAPEQDTPPVPEAAEVHVGEIGDPQAPPIQAPAAPPDEPPAEPPAAFPQADEPPKAPAPRAPDAIRTVLIDAGHGGNDPGYVGQGGVTEKELTLAVAQALRRRLKETTGLKVFLTREDDRERSVPQRVRRAAEVEADLVLSIHGGVSFSPRAHGFEVFYAPAAAATPATDGIRLSSGRSSRQPAAAQSRYIGEAVAEALSETASSESRGVKSAPVRLLRQLPVPGLLIEVGFLTNPAEESLLATDNYRMTLAEGIAGGVSAALGGGEDAP